MALDIKSQLKNLQIALTKVVKEVNSSVNMQDYGEVAAEEIKRQTRLGYGVSATGAPREKLAELKPSTVKSRTRGKKTGVLNELTTPKKSNLTNTGQMLDSIKAQNATTGKVKISATGQHSSGKSNQTLTKYAAEGSPNRKKRPFLNLSDRGVKKVQDHIRQTILKVVKKI
jgi:hypothetical protein